MFSLLSADCCFTVCIRCIICTHVVVHTRDVPICSKALLYRAFGGFRRMHDLFSFHINFVLSI